MRKHLLRVPGDGGQRRGEGGRRAAGGSTRTTSSLISSPLPRRSRRLPFDERLERLAGHRDPDPGESGLADRGDDPVAARRLAADGGPCPVPAELAQERGARQGQQVPGPAGAEGRHQGDGADLRDAEEPFEIAASEEVAVDLFELADGVGEGEQPAGRGGHGATRRSRDGH